MIITHTPSASNIIGSSPLASSSEALSAAGLLCLAWHWTTGLLVPSRCQVLHSCTAAQVGKRCKTSLNCVWSSGARLGGKQLIVIWICWVCVKSKQSILKFDLLRIFTFLVENMAESNRLLKGFKDPTPFQCKTQERGWDLNVHQFYS